MKAKHFLLSFFAGISGLCAQNGHWDNQRATTREFYVKAGERTVIKTENFPIGTTEVVYRITVLDDNQQMANSLVSVLKSIPDPSGVSQGSAGAVFLVSKISGDDKCKYAVFTSNDKASAYKESGKPDNACLAQNTPVSKEAKLLKGGCLASDALFFGFESDNMFLKEKIVLEVVPWVDDKASKGWTKENRKSVMEICGTSGLAQLMGNSDDLCLCILDKLSAKNTFSEYNALTASEKSKLYRDLGNACLDGKSADKTLLNTIRLKANEHFAAKRFDKAIDLLHSGIIVNGNATANDYASIGKYYLFSRQFTKSVQSYKQAEALDKSDLFTQLGLAHALLLSGDFNQARDIHKRYKLENVSASESWENRTRADFTELKSAGLDSKDFERILKLFN